MSTLNAPDSPSQLASDRAPPQYECYIDPRHVQLAPLEPRPSSPVTLPEDMVVEQPSASCTLAGQQLNVSMPNLPTGYSGMRLLLGDTQRKSRVENQIKQLMIFFNGEGVTQYHYIDGPHSGGTKMPPAAIATHASNPAMPLQPGTPGTDSVLSSESDSDHCPLRLEIGGSRSERIQALLHELERKNTSPRRELDLLHASRSQVPPFVHPAPDYRSPDSNSDHSSHSIQHCTGTPSPHQVAGPPFSQKGEVSSDDSTSSYSQDTFLQQQQPPPSTSTRLRWPSTGPSLPQSQQSLSRPTSPPSTRRTLPTQMQGVDRTTRSFTPLGSSPPGPLLPPSPSLHIPSTQLPPFSPPISPPERFSRTATQVVGGLPPSIPEDPEVLEKVLQGVAMLGFDYRILCFSAAMLDIDSFSNDPHS